MRDLASVGGLRYSGGEAARAHERDERWAVIDSVDRRHIHTGLCLPRGFQCVRGVADLNTRLGQQRLTGVGVA